MDPPTEFNQEFDLIADYVEEIGHNVADRNVSEIISGTVNEEEYIYSGHRCDSEQGRYLVLGHPDLRYMSILYILSVTQNIAQDLDDELARKIVGSESGDEADLHSRAAEKLLANVPENEMASLETYIFMFIGNGPQEVLFQQTEDGALGSFTVETQFFPYEDSFSLREFYRSVRTAVSAGRRGSWLLPRSLGISDIEDGEKEVELHINLSW